MTVDLKRLKTDLDYWNEVAPAGATHYIVPGDAKDIHDPQDPWERWSFKSPDLVQEIFDAEHQNWIINSFNDNLSFIKEDSLVYIEKPEQVKKSQHGTDPERLKTDLGYWNEIAPAGATHYIVFSNDPDVDPWERWSNNNTEREVFDEFKQAWVFHNVNNFLEVEKSSSLCIEKPKKAEEVYIGTLPNGMPIQGHPTGVKQTMYEFINITGHTEWVTSVCTEEEYDLVEDILAVKDRVEAAILAKRILEKKV